jgi:hypothetical protein
MMDDPALMDRRSAYIDTLRGLYRPQRTAGFVACLVGVMLLVLARFRFGGQPVMLWGGAAIVAVGWGLFVYAILGRLRWVRAHPFNPNG